MVKFYQASCLILFLGFFAGCAIIFPAGKHDVGSYRPHDGSDSMLVRGWGELPVGDVRAFNIYMSDISGKNYSKANDEPITQHSILIYGVKAGKRYYFVLTALAFSENTWVESKPSEEFSRVANY